MCNLGFLDHDTGDIDMLLDRFAQQPRNGIQVSTQTFLALSINYFGVVIGMAAGDLAYRGFTLDLKVIQRTLNIESRSGGILYAPRDHRGNFNRIAAFIVHFKNRRVPIVDAQ